MWIAGLRGAMAYALALDTSKQSEAGKVMLLITLIYSYFTILGVSSILYPIMMMCGVQSSRARGAQDGLLAEETNYLTRSLTHEELIIMIDKGKPEEKRSCFSRFKIKLSLFDMQYISPNFIKNIDHDFVLLDPHGWDRTLVKTRKAPIQGPVVQVNRKQKKDPEIHKSPVVSID